jgi:3-phenylpropionate/cinnamic acid dioxygenase small subunit
MRIEDRLTIEELLSRYAWASDGRDFAALRDCFSDEAALVLRQADGREETVEGAAAIAAWVEQRHRAEFARGVRRRHLTTNFLLHACDGAQAFATSYFCVLQAGDGEALHAVAMGHYEDAFRRTAAGWRIQRRLVVLEGRAEAPPSPAMP